MYNFYAVIIGTEILNGRREDKHFIFIRDLLKEYGHTLFCTFIIKDDKDLMRKCYKMIKEDAKAVLFNFGGIGSTPDDLTREIAAEIFTQKPLVVNESFKQDIIERFKQEAYPHRIHMAQLPINANLIKNPINNMSGFELDHRYFFVPGFVQMSHPMLKDCVKKYFATSKRMFRRTLLADISENFLIDIMKTVPCDVELSSLPILKTGTPQVELSLSFSDEKILAREFKKFTNFLDKEHVKYKIL